MKKYIISALLLIYSVFPAHSQEIDLSKEEVRGINNYYYPIRDMLKEMGLSNYYTASSDKLFFMGVAHITASSEPIQGLQPKAFIEDKLISIVKAFDPEVIIVELTGSEIRKLKNGSELEFNEQVEIAKYGIGKAKTVFGFELTEEEVIDGISGNGYVKGWINDVLETYFRVDAIKEDAEEMKKYAPVLYDIVVNQRITPKQFICDRILTDLYSVFGEVTDLIFADEEQFNKIKEVLAKGPYEFGKYSDLYNSISIQDMNDYWMEYKYVEGTTGVIFLDVLMRLRDYNLLKLIKNNKDKKVLVSSGAVHYMNVQGVVGSWNDGKGFSLTSIE